MAQAFVSTYKNHYRWNCQPKVSLFDATKLTKLEPEGDIWLLDLNGEAEEELENLPKIEEAINRLYLRRMRSTYQVSYCDKLVKPLKRRSDIHVKAKAEQSITTQEGRKESIHDAEIENELLEYCKKLYGRRSRKIIPPLDSARNVFGYMRPTGLLTPLTIYQNEYGRVGYNILRSDQQVDNK